jgi:hypothetical protein
MPLAVRCPGCRTVFEAPDRLAGKLIRCKSCREEFRVRDDRPADDDIVDRPRPRPRRRPFRRKSGGLPLGLTVAGGAVIFIVLALCGGMFGLARLGIRKVEPIPAMTAQLVTLSNLRRDGSGYSVDYAYVNKPQVGDSFTLKVRTRNGTSDVWMPFMWQQAQSTMHVQPFGGQRVDDRGRVEVWLAKSTGERVSNVLTLD